MMKRNLLISALLLFLFIFPSQAAGLSCFELKVRYFLACEEGSCEGFKVREEPKGGACQRLPYVVDLRKEEGRQIHDYLYSVTEQIEMNGFWSIDMDQDCAFVLRDDRNDEQIQDRFRMYCGIEGERIRIESLAENGDDQSLQTLRETEEKEARSVRLYFYFSQILWSALALLFGAFLPMFVILKYVKTRNRSFIPYVVLVLIAQIGIFIYLLNLSMLLSPDWAKYSFLIIVPLFLIAIGVLIGAKLENRYHKTRFH